ncbi:MAG: GatB/YqeY domain-containing protein [Candidatus Omnitrophica bacterium]|nr:GatB/YqeY domain-containing protein [Candidatus Omnitrophota bacterium]
MLEEKILAEYKEAMKSQDKLRSSTLSFLRAELMNAAIAKKKKALDDAEVIAVVKKQIKQRQDSIEQFTKGNRQDLAAKEQAELTILEVYLPPQLTDDELKKIIEETAVSLSAQGPQDMGKVMKEVSLKVGQQADGKKVSEFVRARLSRQA